MYTKSTLSTTRKPRENAFQTPQLTRFYPLRRPKTHFIVASMLLKTGDSAGALTEIDLGSDYERT